MGRVLITGGAGFIGSHTAEQLVCAGHHGTILDDFSSGSRANLAAIGAGMEVLTADVCDTERMRRVIASHRYDAVIHLAARPSVAGSLADPLGSFAVNVNGTLNVLEAARQAGVRRVVVASSAAVYGRTTAPPCDEQALTVPCSPYGAHKVAAEALCAAYYAAYAMEPVILRYFNVYGPRQPAGGPYSGVIAAAITHLRAETPLIIDGDGEQTRDFVHVSDVAAVNLRAALGPYPGPEPINIARGRATSVLGLVTLIRHLLRVDAVLRFGPARPGDVRHSWASVSRLQQCLGYEAAIRLEDGLQRLLAGDDTSP